MKKIALLLLTVYFFSCNSKNDIPDVSGIPVNVKIERFDKDFFALDSNHLSEGLQQLEDKYPGFYDDYMQGILGVSGVNTDTSTLQMTRIMLTNYEPVFIAADARIAASSGQESEIKRLFQFVKYYFPEYKVPGVISFIGTMDAPGMVLTDRFIAIGLHQSAGKDFPGYQSEQVMQLYPLYISRRFEPEYIPANCAKAVVSDIVPDKSKGLPLIEQMIEKGKQWWLLDKFMPKTADSLKTGYTKQQLEWCNENEGLIWSYIIKNEDLNSINPITIQNYIGEAPFTQGFSPELSPGNIGQWIGWQIVKKYAEKKPKAKLQEILQATPRQILDGAGYKPK